MTKKNPAPENASTAALPETPARAPEAADGMAKPQKKSAKKSAEKSAKKSGKTSGKTLPGKRSTPEAKPEALAAAAAASADSAPALKKPYPFPPPPEALPWEGIGEPLAKRKDQLEINRRGREELVGLLDRLGRPGRLKHPDEEKTTVPAKEGSASGSDAPREENASNAPEIPAFASASAPQEGEKQTACVEKIQVPQSIEKPQDSPGAEKTSNAPKKSAKAANGTKGTNGTKAMKATKAAAPPKKKPAAKRPQASKGKPTPQATVDTPAHPEMVGIFRNAQDPARATVEPSSASSAEPEAPAAQLSQSVQAPEEAAPAASEPTRYSSARSSVFGASLGEGLKALSEGSEGSERTEASQASENDSAIAIDADGSSANQNVSDAVRDDVPHFVSLGGRRKNLASLEKPREPMRELLPFGTDECLRAMTEPDWKEKFIAESLALRDRVEEEAQSEAVRRAAAAAPLSNPEAVRRAQIEWEAIKGERARLLITDHPDLLAAFPDDAEGAFLSVLRREVRRLETKAGEIARDNPADPRLSGVLKALETAAQAALPAFEREAKALEARLKVLRDLGAVAFLGPEAPDQQNDRARKHSALLEALLRIGRGEIPKFKPEDAPTPTSLWLNALEALDHPAREASASEASSACARASAASTSAPPNRESFAKLANGEVPLSSSLDDAKAHPRDSAGAAGVLAKRWGEEKRAGKRGFLLRPASFGAALAGALLSAALVPTFISTLFPSPVVAVVDSDHVRERIALLRIAHTRPGMPEREDLKGLDAAAISNAVEAAGAAKGLPVLDAKALLSAADSPRVADLTPEVFERLGILPEELRVLDYAVEEGWAADLSEIADAHAASDALLRAAEAAEANPPSPQSDHDFIARVKRTLKSWSGSGESLGGAQ